MTMIPPDSSWISPKRISVSTFTRGGTPKPSVSPLGPSKQQQLPLNWVSLTPYPHQDSASEEVPSPSESTHGRGNNDDETENLTASTARRLFKGKVSHPNQLRRQWKGRFHVELNGGKKDYGDEQERSLSPEDVSLSQERGDHGLSTHAGGNDEPGRRRSMDRSKDKSRDDKSTDGQAVLSLPDMKVSPMELGHPNDHLEYHEGNMHITRPDNSVELTDHA